MRRAFLLALVFLLASGLPPLTANAPPPLPDPLFPSPEPVPQPAPQPPPADPVTDKPLFGNREEKKTRRNGPFRSCGSGAGTGLAAIGISWAALWIGTRLVGRVRERKTN